MLVDYVGWHISSEDYPAELGEHAGAKHIGMFMAWAIEHDLLTPDTTKKYPAAILAVRNRNMLGSELVVESFKGRLDTSVFCDLARDFIEEYYEMHFIDDYFLALDPSMQEASLFHIEDNWTNYDRLKMILNHRWHYWKQRVGFAVHRFSSRNYKEMEQMRMSINTQQAALIKSALAK